MESSVSLRPTPADWIVSEEVEGRVEPALNCYQIVGQAPSGQIILFGLRYSPALRSI